MKKLLKVALVVGAITAVAKLVTAKKAEWQGLTESQVREKLDSQLPDRMPDDKRAEVSDKVVSKMRERDMLLEEDEATTPAPEDNGATSADSAETTADDEAGEDTEQA
ncbi:MAG: hypothetical protein GY926_07190 [bacterium]|nr:hypothetical protein [bacterium]MCP4965003.1 hypothetical protein [bacterium]